MEIWKPVVGYESLYEVSSLGRLRSLPRRGTAGCAAGRRYGGVLLKQTMRFGYAHVGLSAIGKKLVNRRVHGLVLAAFVGPVPDGQQTRHLNGVSHDNRLVNLAYGTATENAADKLLHGTALYGARNHQTKLSQEARDQIRARYPSETQTALAAAYGVTQAAIWHVLRSHK